MEYHIFPWLSHISHVQRRREISGRSIKPAEFLQYNLDSCRLFAIQLRQPWSVCCLGASARCPCSLAIRNLVLVPDCSQNMAVFLWSWKLVWNRIRRAWIHRKVFWKDRRSSLLWLSCAYQAIDARNRLHSKHTIWSCRCQSSDSFHIGSVYREASP